MKNKNVTFILGFLLAILLSSCQMDIDRYEETIIARIEETVLAFTEVPTNTPYSTFTPFPTYTPYPTLTNFPTQTPQIIVVTATFTHTPEFSPTVTDTPTITPSPTPTSTITPTPDQTKLDKSPGFYLVGSEISPGVWRSLGTGDSCYWAITTRTGSIINNHFGMAGGTMFIPSTAFEVELTQDCGRWTYLDD